MGKNRSGGSGGERACHGDVAVPGNTTTTLANGALAVDEVDRVDAGSDLDGLGCKEADGSAATGARLAGDGARGAAITRTAVLNGADKQICLSIRARGA